ncbi:hypothetical protein H4R18_002131 [Coemansia javaensis]|uniref:DUF726-domain-containing protein n=1 Tax=Coemansia javaensis TaxID=2761396 RepID=A0A9W8HFE4_9FUNG|nr:hypothetical protein H4R18_002131 [Coemansia javaensis]
MATPGSGARANAASRAAPRLAQPLRAGPGRLLQAHEYEGPFPWHPSRGRTGTSMSVVVPDRPAPLGSAPGATAHRHDRRRDYFTDSGTLGAAMGRSAPKDAGIQYHIRDHSSAEPTDIMSAPASRAQPPAVLRVEAGGSRAGASGRASKRRSGGGRPGPPLFRRAEGTAGPSGAAHSDYAPGSQLPRFMHSRLQGALGPAPEGGCSATQSPETAAPGSASAMQSMLEIEEARLLEAERRSQLRAVDSILTDDQKIAYVGLVYLILVDMQARLNVQYKESQSSTASFMNFSRRLMRAMYSHICLSAEEQRMIELLPRHKVSIADMAQSLAVQGDTILVEADRDLAVVHSPGDDELIDALRSSSECRSSSESARGAGFGWLRGRKKARDDDKDDVYSQYSALPTEGLGAPDAEPDSHDLGGLDSPERADAIPRPASVTGAMAPSGHNRSSSTLSASAPARDSTQTAPALGSTSDGATLTRVSAEQTLAIDVRATLVLDMFLLLLNDDVYDSRGRYLLRRLAESLRYPWIEAMRCERRVTRQLGLHDYAANVTQATQGAAGYAVKERAKKGKARRMVIIGLATVGGGLVIGLSAGLLAPAIGAGIGATLGAVGIANTGAFFGSIGGTALITGAATMTGSGLAGSQIVRRTRFAEQFEFIPCINEGQTNLILTVPGWLDKADNGVFSFSTLDPVNGDHCSLMWESEALRQLGSSLRMIVGEVFSITLTQTLQHTVLPSLLGPLSIPMWLAKLGYVLDNPWSNGCELALKAGPVVADLLLQRVQGQRPVTLIGYSIGARLIFYALLELASMSAYGLVEDVYLFGAPIVASEEEWRLAASVVGGRFVNAYSTKDWILGFFYRTTNLGRRSVAGLHPISGVNGLENVDVSDEVPGHNAYREVLPLLLHSVGVPVTSVDLHDSDADRGHSDADRAMLSELERAAEMLEEHEKKRSVWPWRWPFRDSGFAPGAQQAPSSSSSPPPLPSSPPQPRAAARASAHSAVDAATRELAELGIDVREVPSTLPPLVVERTASREQ